jgi:hypothetical protein
MGFLLSSNLLTSGGLISLTHNNKNVERGRYCGRTGSVLRANGVGIAGERGRYCGFGVIVLGSRPP